MNSRFAWLKTVNLWLALAGLTGVSFNLLSLQSVVVPSCAEALYSATAYTLLTTGRFGLPMFHNMLGFEDTFIDRSMPLDTRLFELGQWLVRDYVTNFTGLSPNWRRYTAPIFSWPLPGPSVSKPGYSPYSPLLH